MVGTALARAISILFFEMSLLRALTSLQTWKGLENGVGITFRFQCYVVREVFVKTCSLGPPQQISFVCSTHAGQFVNENFVLVDGFDLSFDFFIYLVNFIGQVVYFEIGIFGNL